MTYSNSNYSNIVAKKSDKHLQLSGEYPNDHCLDSPMKSTRCEMELLIDGVLKVLDDDGDHDFDILTGKVRLEPTVHGDH